MSPPSLHRLDSPLQTPHGYADLEEQEKWEKYSMVGLFIKIAITIVGVLAVIKGVNDGFVSNKSIEQANWIKLVLGLMFVILGIFLIYFGDLFSPVTKFLRPFVLGILEFPERLSSHLERTARRNMYR